MKNRLIPCVLACLMIFLVLDSYCIRTIGDLANNDPEFLRRRLGKNILKVSRTTVYELLKSKKFHSVRVGGQYRISKKSFENWLNGEKGGSEDGIC